MKAAEVWALLLGAVVALAGTLLAQWSSLAYQTRRQREARRADFQRSALIQIRDALLELSEAIRSVFLARYEAEERATWDSLAPFHPTTEAVRGILDRLLILSAALEDDQLRGKVEMLVPWARMTAEAMTKQDADERRKKMNELQRDAVRLLGEQLRGLP
jgi:hypothetical protein